VICRDVVLEAYASARGSLEADFFLPRPRLGIDGSALPASIVDTARSIKIKRKPQEALTRRQWSSSRACCQESKTCHRFCVCFVQPGGC